MRDRGFPNTVITVTRVTNENQSDKQAESNQDLVCEKQEQNIATIGHIEKNITNSASNLVYQYTLEQIEKCFASDNGQVEEYSLEDNICRPLIGKQIHKPFFHYCKICPKVEFLSLESIEHHIKFKDPECHKAKLLEMIRGDQTDKDENKNG